MNTLGIGLYELAVGFPVPILLALMINEVRSKRFKRLYKQSPMHPTFVYCRACWYVVYLPGSKFRYD